MNKFEALLAEEKYLLLDGAMGTMLMAAGLEQGAPPEEWNVTHPERVQAVHQGYIAAGSNIILTNSFGGTRFRLKLHNLQGRVTELNKAAAENARAAADAAERPVIVGGSIGPTGELMTPMGTMTFEAARDAFAEQTAGLAAGGVDVLWVETMSDLEEVRAAIEGARSVTDLPIVATMTFDTNGHTMMGVSPAQAMEILSQYDLAALGANCGNGPDEIESVIQTMYAINPDIPLIAKSNAGIPHWHGDDLIYDGTPSVMADYTTRVQDLGARLVGGCCGSSPAHIEAMAAALDRERPLPDPTLPAETAVAAKSPTRERRRRRRR